MIPKGKLLIIGGAEDKGGEGREPDMKGKNRNFRNYEILGELVPPDKSEEHCIEIITTASEEPEEMSRTYSNAFRKMGFQNIHHIGIRTREEAKDPEYLRRIERANVVLFSGGDQLRLSTILGGSPVIEAISKKYYGQKDFLVAGTSAGAMAMSKMMIFQGQSNEALLKGDLGITLGFGLIDNCIIDTHFIKRGRFGRLAQAVIMNPTCIGIGLGEDTALVIKRGNHAECRGSGMVIIIDGRKMGHTNIAYAEEGTPLCVENLRVHILANGDGYMIKDRHFVISKKHLEAETSASRNGA
jgi:cyanophycinase